jgi:hypothetical protein
MLDKITLVCASIKLVHQSQIFLLLFKLQPLIDKEYVDFKLAINMQTLKALGADISKDSAKNIAACNTGLELESFRNHALNQLNTATICLVSHVTDLVTKSTTGQDAVTVALSLGLLRSTVGDMSADTVSASHGTVEEAFKVVQKNIIEAKQCVDGQEFDVLLNDLNLSQDYKEQLSLALSIAYANAES